MKPEQGTPAFSAERVDFNPIFPGETLIAALREARAHKGMFNFWDLLPDADRNGDEDTAALDAQSVNAILTVYENLKPSNQAKYLDAFGRNPFVMAGMAWEILKSSRGAREGAE